MAKTQILKRMFGIATLAMLFGAPAVHAQSDSSGSSSSQGMETRSSDTDLSGSGMPDQEQSGSSGASDDASSGAAAGSSSAAAGAESKPMSKSDQRLMNDLTQANMAEIAASNLAKQKSQDEQVQSFAQKMIDDHTEAQEKLLKLAEQKGVTLTTDLDRKQKAEINKMQKLSGDKFDKQYLSEVGRKDHREAHQLLTKIEKQAQDEDLKQLASDMKETIGEHLDMAQDMGRAGAATRASGASGGSAGSGEGGSATATGRPGGNTVDLMEPQDGSDGAASGSSDSTGSGK